jgi:hypothetical protein
VSLPLHTIQSVLHFAKYNGIQVAVVLIVKEYMHSSTCSIILFVDGFKHFFLKPKAVNMLGFVTLNEASQLLHNKFVVILGGSGEKINSLHFNAVYLNQLRH